MLITAGVNQMQGWNGRTVWMAFGMAASWGAVQTASAQPPAVTPGAVQDTLKRTPELKSAPALLSPAAEPPPRADAPPPLPAKTITVEHFEFAGNTLYSSEALNRLVARYTQRPITLVELYEAADRITDYYVRQGYTLASAVVPAQKVTEGTVRLEIIEGRIGQVRYEGLKRYRPADLAYFLDSASGRIYQAGRFETSLRRLDQLPGLDVRARLQPGDDYGSSDVVVQASETPIQGSVFLDNGGTENIGVIRSGAQLILNNPLGRADQLSLTGLRSRQGLLNYLSGAYSLPAGRDGSRVNLSYGYARFDVAGAFQGVSGSNRTARAELLLPVYGSAADQLTAIAAINDTRANTDFSGVPFATTAVTVLEVGGSFSRSYANRALTQVSALLGSNFARYDATTDTASQPLKLDLDFQQLTPLPYALELLTRTQFVYGIDPLPDTQKFSLGGPQTVRGYAPSEARGDWGYLAQASLSRRYLLGSALVVAPRLFYDAGAVRQHQAARFPPSARPQDVSLASYGFGADAGYRNLSLKLDYAVPTSSTPVSDGKEDGRFYGSLSLLF